MLLPEQDTEAFKRWILPKLAISDADPETLADYVVVLLTHESTNESEAEIRQSCLDHLNEFLHDYTVPFVNDFFKALKDKSYIRSPVKAKGTSTKAQPAPENGTAPIPSIVGPSNSQYEPDPLRVAHEPPSGAPTGPAATRVVNTERNALQENVNAARKRKLEEHEQSQQPANYDPHYNRAEGSGRPLKQTARRSGGRHALFGRPKPQNGLPAFIPPPLPPNFPEPPPGAPPLSLLSMLVAFNPALAMSPDLVLPFLQQAPQWEKQPCPDYHMRGLCALGTMCPFEHGNAIPVPAEKVPEYDPERSFLAIQPDRDTGTKKKTRVKSTKAKKAGRPRAEFSLSGPSSDPLNTTLVVEQIPQTHFNEDNVRKSFSKFGAIFEVTMHAQKRLAVIKFEDRESAQQAYNSPLAIFDNRFVKVYWHKSDFEAGQIGVDLEANSAAQEEEEKLDLEEIAKRQAAAQAAFEARRKKMRDVDSRAEEVEKQLKVKDEEIISIRQQLSLLSADEFDASQSLAILQAEAADLFAQHDGLETFGRGQSMGRGRYRGRGDSFYIPRGRGYTSTRGGYRGRGALLANGRSSVKRLDNRPRRMAISPIEPESSKDEALRQYLINVTDCTDIDRHPEEENTLILSFKERYQAEIFADAVHTISDIGKVKLSWIANDAFGGPKSALLASSSVADSNDDDAESSYDHAKRDRDAVASNADTGPHGNATDVDMDVADDVDQWR